FSRSHRRQARRGSDVAVRPALVDTRPLRTSAAFRRLWICGTFSAVGGQMTAVAVMFQIWQDTHSTMWTGAVGVAQAAPLIAFGMFAGAYVDRVDRRRLYLICRIAQAGSSIVL